MAWARQCADRSAGYVLDLARYHRVLSDRLFPVLGEPRSLKVILQGLFPISPQRVLVFDSREAGETANRWIGERRAILARLAAERADGRARVEANRDGLSDEKLGLILWLVRNLTHYYKKPQWWLAWASNMARRESLMSTGWLHHLAFPHQYQYYPAGSANVTIATDNGRLDWWMVLVPGGTKAWRAPGDRPTCVLLTHVFASPILPNHTDRPVLFAGQAAAQAIAQARPTELAEIAQMDRATAAKTFNGWLLEALEQL